MALQDPPYQSRDGHQCQQADEREGVSDSSDPWAHLRIDNGQCQDEAGCNEEQEDNRNECLRYEDCATDCADKDQDDAQNRADQDLDS